jgi:hypothetical protein
VTVADGPRAVIAAIDLVVAAAVLAAARPSVEPA